MSSSGYVSETEDKKKPAQGGPTSNFAVCSLIIDLRLAVSGTEVIGRIA